MHSFYMNIFFTCLKLLFFFSHIKILLSTQSCVSIINVNAYIKKEFFKFDFRFLIRFLTQIIICLYFWRAFFQKHNNGKRYNKIKKERTIPGLH